MSLLGITGGGGYLGRALTERLGEVFPIPCGPSTPLSDRLPVLERVVHLAGFESELPPSAGCLDFESLHGRSLLALLQALDRGRLQRFVNVGLLHPWDPRRPATPAGVRAAASLGAELLLDAYAYHEEFEAVHLRLAEVYGPGMPGPMATIVAAARENAPIVLPRLGRDRLHLIYRDDAAEAILAALGADRLEGAFEVSAGAVTTEEVARTILELTRSRSELRLLPGDDDGPATRDTAVVPQLPGFEARTSLRQGLTAILAGRSSP